MLHGLGTGFCLNGKNVFGPTTVSKYVVDKGGNVATEISQLGGTYRWVGVVTSYGSIVFPPFYGPTLTVRKRRSYGGYVCCQ